MMAGTPPYPRDITDDVRDLFGARSNAQRAGQSRVPYDKASAGLLFPDLGADPATPGEAGGRVYSKGGKLYYRSSSGSIYNLVEPVVTIGEQPKALVRRATTLAMTNSGSANVISWDTQIYSSGAVFGGTGSSPTNQRLNAPVTGMYLVVGYLQMAASAAGTFRTGVIRHSVDGVLMEDNKGPISGQPVRLNPTITHYCIGGSYFQLEGWHDTGGTLNLESGRFSLVLLP